MAHFGLFGGGCSDSEEEKQEDEGPRISQGDGTDEPATVAVQDIPDKLKASKWKGVIEEYDASTFLHNFVKDEEFDVPDAHKQEITTKNATVDGSSKETNEESDALDAHKEETKTEHAEIPTELMTSHGSYLSKEKCSTAIQNMLINQKNAPHKLARAKEEEEKRRDVEIEAIQRDIAKEREIWEPVYSDEEMDDTEFKYKKRKQRPQLPHSPSESMEDGLQFTKGERWKRLKSIAETRVKSNPEKYSSIPINHFPLRP